jgi:hypothetical protein
MTVITQPPFYPPKQTKAAVPVPGDTLEGLRASIEGLKEIAEVLDGQRGSNIDAAVTWRDLVQLGLIQPESVPTRGPDRL